MRLGLYIIVIGILAVLYYLSRPMKDSFQGAAAFKVFNLDLHQSVIEDVKNILSTLYGDKIDITNWSISNHNHYFGKPTADVKVITQDTWRSFDMNMIEQFQQEYDSILSNYDAFIVTHTPVFAMLYEKYGKPIIIVNSCRYDQPFCWNNDTSMLKLFNTALKRMNDSGQLIAVSNNLAEQKYLKDGAGIDSTYIPSLCLYTNAKYDTPGKSTFLLFDKKASTHFPETNILVNRPENYQFSDLVEYKGIVHMPYDISSMSLFEQYFAGIPLFFPEKEFYKRCIREGKAEFIAQYNGWGRTLTKEELESWLINADYYNFKYIHYYSSFEECVRQLNSFVDTQKEERLAWVEKVKEDSIEKWKSLVDKIIYTR